jgi:hypothetical protein
MDRDTPVSLRLPSLESLPGADATLEQMIGLAHTVDPTAHFQQRWGEEYRARAQALWHRCVQSYKDGLTAGLPSEELLMCLAYDVTLGPYLGVPEPHKLPFLRWLVDGVRRDLQGSAARDKIS